MRIGIDKPEGPSSKARDALIGEARRLDLQGPILNIIKAADLQLSAQGTSLRVRVLAPLRGSGDPEARFLTFAQGFGLPADDDPDLVKKVRKTLRDALAETLVHELDEWLTFDGHLEFDPHEGGTAAVVGSRLPK